MKRALVVLLMVWGEGVRPYSSRSDQMPPFLT